MSVEVEIQGQDGIGAALEAAMIAAIGPADGIEISIVAGGARGQAVNTMIAKVQAKQMRDPFYLDAQARESIRNAAQGITAKQYSTRRRAVEIIVELMKRAIVRNVDAQQNASGTGFKPLSPKYAAFKRRKFGYVTPILKASGDLLGGLKGQISKLY